jgi:hypothetical protein
MPDPIFLFAALEKFDANLLQAFLGEHADLEVEPGQLPPRGVRPDGSIGTPDPNGGDALIVLSDKRPLNDLGFTLPEGSRIFGIEHARYLIQGDREKQLKAAMPGYERGISFSHEPRVPVYDLLNELLEGRDNACRSKVVAKIVTLVSEGSGWKRNVDDAMEAQIKLLNQTH